MKERATIVCWQDGKVLLVERGRLRWSLPGGTIRRNEAPIDAARRELAEETTLPGNAFEYLFEFGGLNKRHHVFFAVFRNGTRAKPSNEIVRCRWFRPANVATLVASVPTRQIVALLFNPDRAADVSGRIGREVRRGVRQTVQLKELLFAISHEKC